MKEECEHKEVDHPLTLLSAPGHCVGDCGQVGHQVVGEPGLGTLCSHPEEGVLPTLVLDKGGVKGNFGVHEREDVQFADNLFKLFRSLMVGFQFFLEALNVR